MRKKESKDWPELIVSRGDKASTQSIRRAAKAGILRKIASKIYSSNLIDTPENIIKRHRYQILGQMYPNSIISHRSAFDGGISPDGIVFLTYKYTKVVKFPGLTVRLLQGPGPDPEDTPFLENLYISSRGRAFLENISSSRERLGYIKNVSQQMIEERLDRMARIYGSEELNLLRDQARRIALRLEMKKEFVVLDKLIGSFLGTQPSSDQKSEAGKARARGEPFDPQRVELFATLTAYLQHHNLPIYKRTTISSQAKINQAFFESYFSNYIEGTQFEIKEAEQIIFENKIFPSRPEDSHDILGTFQIVSSKKMMETIPETPAQLIQILQQRHAILMETREDTRPGHFKDVANRAGNTIFVRPEEVRGTLFKGYEFYRQLPKGISRAIFMMFLISEIHPFIDGNGRIARILMNAELDVVDQSRIIIPTVYREDYLLSLRKLSRKYDPAPYVRMLSYAQQFTASISYEEYSQTLVQFQSCNAFLEPNEGKLIIPNL
jgi:Fic family protein